MTATLPTSLSFHAAEPLFNDIRELNLKKDELAPADALLEFTAQVQISENWCWSAVATSVGVYYGTGNWTQCAIATAQVNDIIFPGELNNCCATSSSSHCNVYGYLFFSLQQVGAFDYWESKKPTAETLFEILSRQRELLCLRIAWYPVASGAAHFTTICGCTNPADSDVMATLSDTIKGVGTTTLPYADFPANYLGGGQWTDTFRTRGRFGPSQYAGTGDSIVVAIDNNGNCVSIYAMHGKLFSRVGHIDPINRKVTWGNDLQFESGTQASVALDNDANCLEVHTNDGKMFYRVGKLDVCDMTVDWQAVNEYGTGDQNSVALADYGIALEVHRAGKHLYYQVGSVEDDGTITWVDYVWYGNGSSNNIAIDNHGNCVEVHAGIDATAGMLFFRVGKVDYIGSFRDTEPVSSIMWGADMQFDIGTAPAIALASTGECLVAFTGTGKDCGRILFRGGKVNATRKTVEWYPRVPFDTGERASAALNDCGKCIELHVSGQHLFSRVGR